MIEIAVTDPGVLADPVAAYGHARERGPVARLVVPGMPDMWAVLRYADVRAMLADPTFELRPDSYAMRPRGVPDDCLPYLRTMQEMDGREHQRLRRLVAPAFTATRATSLRPGIETIVTGLLDRLGASFDLLADFARPLPMAVICELVGVPEADRPTWQRYGDAVATGAGQAFADAIPGIIAGARAAVADPRPGSLLADLAAADGLDATELVTLVWHLVLAGQTPTNLIANAVAVLLAHPRQWALLRAEPGMLPNAVEELTRWCGPQLLAIPRYAREDTAIAGVRIGRGEPVVAVLAAANRDPRAFTEPDRLDVTATRTGHLGFAHGPHFCLAAPLARVQTHVALGALLRRYPDLAAVDQPRRLHDPATWRLRELRVTRR